MRLLRTVDVGSLRGKRDYATLAILLGCGLRRAELAASRVEDIQQREKHWVIADLIGKGGHIRTIPVPDWVKEGIDAWIAASGITGGILLPPDDLGTEGVTPDSASFVEKGASFLVNRTIVWGEHRMLFSRALPCGS